MLEFACIGFDHPIALITEDSIAESLELLRSTLHRMRTERGTEALISQLVLIHELSNQIVLRLGRGTDDATVVRESEEHSSPVFMTGRCRRVEPPFGNQIEQGRRGHQLAARKEAREVFEFREIHDASRGGWRQIGATPVEEHGIVIDEEP